jgi:hypothetical protein
MKKLLLFPILAVALSASTQTIAYDLPIPTCGMYGQNPCPPSKCDTLSGWAYLVCIFNGS